MSLRCIMIGQFLSAWQRVPLSVWPSHVPIVQQIYGNGDQGRRVLLWLIYVGSGEKIWKSHERIISWVFSLNHSVFKCCPNVNYGNVKINSYKNTMAKHHQWRHTSNSQKISSYIFHHFSGILAATYFWIMFCNNVLAFTRNPTSFELWTSI